jgi:hypothetical protein
MRASRASVLPRIAAGEPGFFVLLLAVTLLVYRHSLFDGFISDDYLWLEPPSLGRLLGYFASSWGHGGYFRPVMRLLYAADAWLFGDRPAAWRAVNILIHALNGWLIARVAAHFTGARLAGRVAAVLFVVYPVAVENVAWVSGITHPLCTWFILISLGALYRSLGETRLRAAAIAGVTALAAIWTYDVAVVLPALQVVVVLLQRIERRGEPVHWLGGAIAFGGWAIGNAWRVAVMPDHVYPQYPSLLAALSKHFVAYWEFLLVTVQLRTLAALVAGMAVMLIAFGVAPDRRRLLGRLAAALALAGLSYAPFIPFAGEAYRFDYLSLVFWMVAFALVLDHALRAPALPRLAFATGVVAMVLVSAYETDKLCREWRVVSDTTALMLRQVHTDLPQWPEFTDLAFVGLPDHYRRALGYIGYVEPMIARTFDPVSGRVVVAETVDALPPEPANRRRVVFAWVGFDTGRGEPAGVRLLTAPRP